MLFLIQILTNYQLEEIKIILAAKIICSKYGKQW
jgi:hypothetical protein